MSISLVLLVYACFSLCFDHIRRLNGSYIYDDGDFKESLCRLSGAFEV